MAEDKRVDDRDGLEWTALELSAEVCVQKQPYGVVAALAAGGVVIVMDVANVIVSKLNG